MCRRSCATCCDVGSPLALQRVARFHSPLKEWSAFGRDV